MNSIKVCEYSWSRSFHDDLILQDQASGERSQDQWSSGWFSRDAAHLYVNVFGGKGSYHKTCEDNFLTLIIQNDKDRWAAA